MGLARAWMFESLPQEPRLGLNNHKNGNNETKLEQIKNAILLNEPVLNCLDALWLHKPAPPIPTPSPHPHPMNAILSSCLPLLDYRRAPGTLKLGIASKNLEFCTIYYECFAALFPSLNNVVLVLVSPHYSLPCPPFAARQADTEPRPINFSIKK